jgi:hypothetical protein
MKRDRGRKIAFYLKTLPASKTAEEMGTIQTHGELTRQEVGQVSSET